MNTLAAFHFLRPWWLLALAVAPLLPWLMRQGGESAALRRLADPRMLRFLVESGQRHRHGWAMGMLLAWTLACLALAGPTWQRLPQPVVANRSAQVIVVSMSQRMLAGDQSPDRLTRVRYKIHALLRANRAGQNGLVAYAGAAFTVAPLTRDAHALTDLVDALKPDTMPVDGDNAAAGIRRATRLLVDAGMHHGSIVVIDDHAEAPVLAAARAARAAGMRVSVLGTGTRKGAPIPSRDGGFGTNAAGQVRMARRDDASLKALASAGGGVYVTMSSNASDIQRLAAQLRSRPGTRDTQHKADVWRDNGAWLLLPLLLLMAIGFRRGALVVLPLLLLPAFAPAAHASGWRDAWHTPDQQAARALARGHPRQAESLARDPAVRGTAAYRAGDYATAAKAFAEAPGARNQYNLGNALARMHRYEDAVKAYDRALKTDPSLADARANRKAVLDWMQKHRKPSADSGKGAQGKAGNGAHTKPSSAQNGPAPGQQGAQAGQQQGAKGQGKQQAPSGGNHGKDNPASSASAAPHPAPGKAQDKGAKPGSKADAKSLARAREALKKQLDRQLKGMPAYDLGRSDAQSKDKGKQLPASMQQALEKVPDDPGGLLRNKFMLEYQRRLQRGETSVPAHPDGGS